MCWVILLFQQPCIWKVKMIGIWFSLSYHSFLLLKRSASAEATRGSNFPISSCQVHHPHLTGITGEGRPPSLSPPPPRPVSQPDLWSWWYSLHTHRGTLSLKTHRWKVFRKIMTSTGYIVLVSLLFFTPDKGFADSRNKHNKMFCWGSRVGWCC